MRLAFHQPATPLDAFIPYFWDCADAPSHDRERILPSGTVELVVNLCEDEVRICDPEQPERLRRLSGIVVSGTYAGAFVIDPSQHASMIGVHFRPGGAFPFFGEAVGEISNSHVALEALWGRTAAVELRERVCSAGSPRKRFHILEEALKTRLQRRVHHPAVSLALEIFGPTGTGDTVHSAAKRVGLSRRRFIQLFTNQVGLTPKLFCRVLRFQNARNFVDHAETVNWAPLALECGYYDQSHLIHDFQEFCGLSPTDYLRARSDRLLRNHVHMI